MAQTTQHSIAAFISKLVAMVTGKPVTESGRRSTPAGSPELLEHWYTLATEHFSALEVYDAIEAEIKAQEVPGLTMSRVDLSEGGLLSDNRVYLRMKRERLCFDVCAAPVGVNYFFSYRFYLTLPLVKPWEWIVFLFGLFFLYKICSNITYGVFAIMLFIAICVSGIWIMRNLVALGLRDLDATLMNLPVIGSIYERFFRKDTYYRQDMRIAYCSIVSAIIKNKVETITAEKGVKLLREYMYSPAFDDLYKMKQIKPREKGNEEDA